MHEGWTPFSALHTVTLNSVAKPRTLINPCPGLEAHSPACASARLTDIGRCLSSSDPLSSLSSPGTSSESESSLSMLSLPPGSADGAAPHKLHAMGMTAASTTQAP